MTQLEIARVLSGPRGTPAKKRHLLAMQRQLVRLVLEDGKTPARERALCAGAWERLENRLRILNGKPDPGQMRPTGIQRPARTKKPARLRPAASMLPLPVVVLESTEKQAATG